jgi:hypothetical protein
MIDFEDNLWWAAPTVLAREGVTREYLPAKLCTEGLPGASLGS